MRCGLDGWGFGDDALRRTQPRKPWSSVLAWNPDGEERQGRRRKRRRGRGGKGVGKE